MIKPHFLASGGAGSAGTRLRCCASRVFGRILLATALLTAGLVALFLPSGAYAEGPSSSILIRGVALIDPETDAEPLTVSLLIMDRRLSLVTQDQVPLAQADFAYDAQGGMILGKLELGEPASFMILDGDPRQDIDLLLDTKTHATFAMREGEIVRNRLVELVATPASRGERKPGGWLAYTPPPLAVPLNYRDTSRWNRFDTKYVSGIVAAGLFLDRQNWLKQSADSEMQVGDLTSFDGGEIRGLRFGALGTLNFKRPWVWTVFGATNAFGKGFDSSEDDDFTLFDARLDVPVANGMTLSVGKQKEPISMERVMSLTNLPQQERAAPSDALLPSRNTGIVLSGSLPSGRMTLAAGAFNNWLDRDQPSSFSDNATQYVGRATWVPWQSEDGATLLHLGGGLRYSNAKEGFFVATEPEFDNAPDFVSTPPFEADRLMTYQAEASLRSGPFWLHTDYLQTDIDAPDLGDPTTGGYHITASWVATGEMRSYNERAGTFNKIPIARTVDQNGWGAWEYSIRYSNLDANDQGLDGGELDIWSAGISWWLSPYMNVNLNYRYITLDRLGVNGSNQGINSRIALLLE